MTLEYLLQDYSEVYLNTYLLRYILASDQNLMTEWHIRYSERSATIFQTI